MCSVTVVECPVKAEGGSYGPERLRLKLVIKTPYNGYETIPNQPITADGWRALKAAAKTGGTATWNSELDNVMSIEVRDGNVMFHGAPDSGSTFTIEAQYCKTAFANASKLATKYSLARNHEIAGDFARATPFNPWPYRKKTEGYTAWHAAAILYEHIGSSEFAGMMTFNREFKQVSEKNTLDAMWKFAPKNDAVRAVIEYYRAAAV